MNKKIFVLSKNNAENYECDVNHIFISVRSPNENPANLPNNENRSDSLFLEFYDIDCNSDIIKDKKRYEDGLFNKTNAIEILDFIDKHKDIDTIFVNCESGISRSAGIAAAISKIFNGTDSFYFDHYVPNKYIYTTILGLYYAKFVNPKPSDRIEKAKYNLIV